MYMYALHSSLILTKVSGVMVRGLSNEIIQYDHIMIFEPVAVPLTSVDKMLKNVTFHKNCIFFLLRKLDVCLILDIIERGKVFQHAWYIVSCLRLFHIRVKWNSENLENFRISRFPFSYSLNANSTWAKLNFTLTYRSKLWHYLR